MNFWTFILSFYGLGLVTVVVMGAANRLGLFAESSGGKSKGRGYCPRCGCALERPPDA